MNTPVHKYLQLPLLIEGIAAILFSAVAFSAVTASIETPVESLQSAGAGSELPGAAPPAIEAPTQAMRDTRSKARCEECGVIESTRVVEIRSASIGADALDGTAAGKRTETAKVPARIHQTVVRMRDGSMLVIDDVYPERWRPGERVKLIAGMQ